MKMHIFGFVTMSKISASGWWHGKQDDIVYAYSLVMNCINNGVIETTKVLAN